MINRTPGEGRYAHIEREQRWRLVEPPRDLEGRKEILDHYLTGMTLRLRRLRSESDVVYKLTQKVRAEYSDPEVVKITNIYLSPVEYESLRKLASASIRKFRYVHSSDQRQFAIDVFADRHEGLVLAELELAVHDPRVPMPPFASQEVSNDDRFSGGALARASDEAIRTLLTSLHQ